MKIFQFFLNNTSTKMYKGGAMKKEELYKLSHNLWKTKVLIEKAYELTLKTIEDEKNMPFLEVALNEITIGMLTNLENLIEDKK